LYDAAYYLNQVTINLASCILPTIIQPWQSPIEKIFVTESGTISLSGTFFLQQTTTLSFPLIAIEVCPNY